MVLNLSIFQSYIFLLVDEDYTVSVQDVEVLRGNTAILRYVITVVASPAGSAIPHFLCGTESRGICDAGFAGLNFG